MKDRERDERERLVEDAMPFARALARRFSRNRPSLFEDFVSAAHLALVEASLAFDPERGVAFTTFAYKRVVNAIRDEARDVLDGGWKRAFDERPRFVPDPASDLNRLVDRGDDLGLIQTADDFLVELAKLPKRLKSAFRLLYCEGLDGRRTARVLGVSPATVSRLNRRLMERLAGYRIKGGLSEVLAARLAPAVAA